MKYALTTICHNHHYSDGEGNFHSRRKAFDVRTEKGSYHFDKKFIRSGTVTIPLIGLSLDCRLAVYNDSKLRLKVVHENLSMVVPPMDMLYIPAISGEQVLIVLHATTEQKFHVSVTEVA